MVRRGPLYTAVSMTIDRQRELLEGVAEVDQTEIPFRAGNSFLDSQSQVAEPFVWTKSEVHQRRVNRRRLSDL